MLKSAGRIVAADLVKTGLTHVTALTDLSGTAVAAARQAITWGSAGSGGIVLNSAANAIPIAIGEAAMVAGIYGQLSGGSLLGLAGIGSAGQVITGLGTVDASTDLLLSKAHGLSADMRIFFDAVNAESLPAGLSATVLYFVLASGLTTDAFKVSTTSGGSAVDITVSGEFSFETTVPQPAAVSTTSLGIAIGALSYDQRFA